MTQDPKITQIDRYIERTDAEDAAYENVEHDLRERIDEYIFAARERLDKAETYAERLIQRVRIKAYRDIKNEL
jgi:hypothetical protein